MLIIEQLAKHKEYTDTVINWIWNEWGDKNNYSFFESIVKHSFSTDNLPITFVAILDGEIVGTVGLWRSDLVSRQDLFPWLSALYVKESYRGRKIGEKLQRFLIEYCKKQGYKELFLYTDLDNYYEKTGWQRIEDGVEYSGESIKVYKMNSTERKECEVKYLGHSGWTVKTQNSLLIFDYTKINSVVKERKVINSTIEEEKLKDENLHVFISHEHEDHYDKSILDLKNYAKKVKYIFGWRSEETEEYIQIGPNEDLNVDNIEITTIDSTDDGVGFLVKTDGITILHLGDHANWSPECDSFYREQVDFIARKCEQVDIVFVPIAKGSGARPQCITDGAQYVIDKLNAKVVFPMHAGGREYLYKEFAEEINLKHNNQKVICASKPDDAWRLSIE